MTLRSNINLLRKNSNSLKKETKGDKLFERNGGQAGDNVEVWSRVRLERGVKGICTWCVKHRYMAWNNAVCV